MRLRLWSARGLPGCLPGVHPPWKFQAGNLNPPHGAIQGFTSVEQTKHMQSVYRRYYEAKISSSLDGLSVFNRGTLV